MLACNQRSPVTTDKRARPRYRRNGGAHDVIMRETLNYELSVIMRNFLVIHNEIAG